MADQLAIFAPTVDSLRKWIEQNRFKKIFLVTGKSSYDASGAKAMLEAVLKIRQVVRFNNFSTNPNIKDVYLGANRLRDADPDVIIAVGGGSVIDMAKLLNGLSSHPDESFKNLIQDQNPDISKHRPIAVIPTTAGSGSEATHFAVVYMDQKKFSLAHENLMPDLALICPPLTYNLPQYTAASSAVDALSQAVESLWARQATPLSRYYAEKAIKLIWPSIKGAVKQQNKTAKNHLLLGSHFAGKAINISKTTAPHAMSYPLTINHGLSHGHAVGILVGRFLILHSLTKFNDTHLNKAMSQLCDYFECNRPEELSNKWYELLEHIGLEINLNKLGINDVTDKQRIVENANMERLRNHPIQITSRIVYDILDYNI